MDLGEASRDSSGFGAMEVGLISSSGRNLRVLLLTSWRLRSDSDRRVPVEFAQECQVSCSAEEWNSAYISSCSRMTPLFVMCVEPAGFSQMHGGISAPSCCAFIHRVAFEEVSGHRVLLKCGPGNRGLSACCTTHEATSRISS